MQSSKLPYIQHSNPYNTYFLTGVILCEITHSKNESLPIVFILSTQSLHPMRVNNPEYQPPVTSGSRETGYANFVN